MSMMLQFGWSSCILLLGGDRVRSCWSQNVKLALLGATSKMSQSYELRSPSGSHGCMRSVSEVRDRTTIELFLGHIQDSGSNVDRKSTGNCGPAKPEARSDREL